MIIFAEIKDKSNAADVTIVDYREDKGQTSEERNFFTSTSDLQALIANLLTPIKYAIEV